MRFYRLILLTALLALALSQSGQSHEMFLKAKAYRLAPDTKTEIELVNGTFEASENNITRDRMQGVTVHGGGTTVYPDPDNWRDEGLSTILDHQVGASGTYVIGVSTKPRMIDLSNQSFREYLKHEGVLDTLQTFEEAQNQSDVRERYSKHVKTLVQVSAKTTDDHKKILGYPVEIILEDNPYASSVGDTLRVQLFRGGEPLANQLVYASHSGYHSHDEDGGHERAVAMRTDSDGRAEFTPSQAGIWYITFIHMAELQDDPKADYESNWATLTFELGN